MYVTLSSQRALAYDFDRGPWEIANRRSFAKVPEAIGLPTALTVDAQGCVMEWQWGGWAPDALRTRMARSSGW